MAHIMIKCPSTGRLIATGTGADPRTFENSSYENMSVTCPACDSIHVWSKPDAILYADS